MKLNPFEQATALLAAACCVGLIFLSASAPAATMYGSRRAADAPAASVQPAEESAEKSADAAADGEKIDINTATYEQLLECSGMDPAAAQLIVAYRNVRGPYDSVYDLLDISGFDREIFDKIEPHIKASR